jgi:hypothetical protein
MPRQPYPIPDSPDLAAAALLDKTADIIERNGWTQGDYVTWNPGELPENCKVCPRGGMSVAAGRHPLFVVEWPGFCPSIFEALATESDERVTTTDDEAALAEISAAEIAFATHIRKIDRWCNGSLTDASVIESWNDDDDRTADEVVTELRACAANLRTAVAS